MYEEFIAYLQRLGLDISGVTPETYLRHEAYQPFLREQQTMQAPSTPATPVGRPYVTIDGQPQSYMPQMLPPAAQQWISSQQQPPAGGAGPSGDRRLLGPTPQPGVGPTEAPSPTGGQFPSPVVETYGETNYLIQYDMYGQATVLDQWSAVDEEMTAYQRKQFEFQTGQQEWQKSQWQQQMGMDAQRLAAETEMERQRILASLSGPRDWVKYSQMAAGQLPNVPEWLPGFVPGQQAGQQISPEWVRTPSAQQFSANAPTAQQGLMGFADWSASMGSARTGEDITGHMRQMLPSQPRGAGSEKWIPAKQR